MKKFIALAISIMMVLSMVVIPVAAEETTVVTPTTASVDPSIWVTAANVEDYMDEAYGGYYCQSNWTKDENGTFFVVGGTKYDRFKWYNDTYSSGNGGFGAFDNMAPKKPVYLTMINGSVYDADTAAEGTEAWEGFRIMADNTSGVGSAYTSTGTIAFSNYNKTMYANKDIRVDSIRFKMDEYDSDSWVTLLGLNDNWRSNDPAYNGANKVTALRIINGGVKYNDLSQGGYVDLLPAETLQADTWYRVEKMADVRIDTGATAEVWQRAIVYVDATNEILGDTGWVKAQDWTKGSTYYKEDGSVNITYPFNTAASGVGKFPAGAHVYFDDFKSWAVDNPASGFLAGDESNYGKYLTYPSGENNINKARNSWALGFSLRQEDYDGREYNTYDSDGDGVKDSRGIYGDHSAEVKAYTDAVKNNKYIYMQEDFMMPAPHAYEIGLFDLDTNVNYNTCYNDENNEWTDNKGSYDGMGGVVSIKDGVLTVRTYDSSKDKLTGYAGKAKTEDGTAEFSLNLENGKWYTAQLQIDQSAYVPMTYVDSKPDLDAAASPTTAQVIITDSEGNTYKTEKFAWKSPRQYIIYGWLQAVIMADFRREGLNGYAITNRNLNLDNMKVAISNTTMDAADAVVLYDENFETRSANATYDSFIMDQFNPQSMDYAYGRNTYALDCAVVQLDSSKIMGLPLVADVTLDTTIKTDTASLASAVKLYKGSVDVSDMISSVAYNEETGKLDMEFTALEPATTYTVVFDRSVAEVEADIFSVIPTATGFTFTTGFDGAISLSFEPYFTTVGVGIEDVGFMEGEDVIADAGTTLKNLAGTESNYVVIAALYDGDNRMEDMMSQVGTIGGNKTVDIDFAGDALTATADTATLKAFVWNTWRLMQPIAGEYVYTVE